MSVSVNVVAQKHSNREDALSTDNDAHDVLRPVGDTSTKISM